jgi:hypothetical protein
MNRQNANIANPVALSARKASFDILAVEAHHRAPQPRRIDVLQRVSR